MLLSDFIAIPEKFAVNIISKRSIDRFYWRLAYQTSQRVIKKSSSQKALAIGEEWATRILERMGKRETLFTQSPISLVQTE